MNIKLNRILFLITLMMSLASLCHAGQKEFQEGKIYIWVARNYTSWENPLQSELSINGKTINIYTTDTFERIGQYLKQGWNNISIKTTPLEPANDGNDLIFRIGPMQRDPNNSARFIMSPVIFKFRNGTDWTYRAEDIQANSDLQ